MYLVCSLVCNTSLLQSGEDCVAKWKKDIADKCSAAGIRCDCLPEIRLTEFVSEAREDKGIWGVPQVAEIAFRPYHKQHYLSHCFVLF